MEFLSDSFSGIKFDVLGFQQGIIHQRTNERTNHVFTFSSNSFQVITILQEVRSWTSTNVLVTLSEDFIEITIIRTNLNNL